MHYYTKEPNTNILSMSHNGKHGRYTARHVRLCEMATQTTDINVTLA